MMRSTAHSSLLRQWMLPSGEQLTLYGRRFAALEPGVAPDDYQQLLNFFGDRLGPGDAVVLVSPDQVYMLGLSLPANAGAAVVPLPLPGETEVETAKRLQDLIDNYGRIFLVSHNAEQVDPDGSIEVWLRANAVAANDEWAGSVRVTPFVTGADLEAGTAAPLAAAAWENGPTLDLASVQAAQQAITPTAGSGLVVTLRWEESGAASPAGGALKASLQLLGGDGALVAQEDREIAAGEQQFVLMIPRSATPGEYKLGLVVYDPGTGLRYPVAGGGGSGRTGDGGGQPGAGVGAGGAAAAAASGRCRGRGQLEYKNRGRRAACGPGGRHGYGLSNAEYSAAGN